MMKKTKNIIIIIIILLLGYFGMKLYNNIISNIETKYKNAMSIQDSISNVYKDSILLLNIIDEQKQKMINYKDSIILVEKKGIQKISDKYNKLRNNMRKIDADSNVKFLTYRLKLIDSTNISKPPKIIKSDKDTNVIVAIEHIKIINNTFIDLDEKIENLLLANNIITLQDLQICDFKDLMKIKDKKLSLKDSINNTNINKLKINDNMISLQSKKIKKLKTQQKFIFIGVGILTTILLVKNL